MRLLCLIGLFFLASCSDRFLVIKNIVQRNCDSYIDLKDIKITNNGTYYLASILRHPTYSKGYNFLVYGNNWDDVIMIVDQHSFYQKNDSLYKEILNLNNRLVKNGIEIEDIYINKKNSFAIRTRTVVNKYQYKVVDVVDLQSLLNVSFEFLNR